MRADKSIERRIQALEKRYPPRAWDLRAVSLQDLEALERVFNPDNSSVGKQPKITQRLLRLITKLEAGAR